MSAFADMADILSARKVRLNAAAEPRSGPGPKLSPGEKYGMWTVLEFIPGSRTGGVNVKPRYSCRCDCGTVRSIFSDSLTLGRSLSCGCRTGRGRISAKKGMQ